MVDVRDTSDRWATGSFGNRQEQLRKVLAKGTRPAALELRYRKRRASWDALRLSRQRLQNVTGVPRELRRQLPLSQRKPTKRMGAANKAP
jgi:hypothetical protein